MQNEPGTFTFDSAISARTFNQKAQNTDKTTKTNTSGNSSYNKMELKEVKQLKKMSFSVSDMRSIMDIVDKKREANGIKSKCVRIIKAKESNINNAMDLAIYFGKNGYVIAGRESTGTAIKGLVVSEEGEIFNIKVGTY